MPSSPRIFRAIPKGRVTQAPSPIPVVVTMRWVTGGVREFDADALAWTAEAVEVAWAPPGMATRSDWIDAVDVRRRGADAARSAADGASSEGAGQVPAQVDQAGRANVPSGPPRVDTRRRARW